MGARRIWIARALVAVVFLMNVLCALQFIVWPSNYAVAYQLEGPASEAIVRSFGICFLMWNATYPPVIAHPDRFRVLYCVIIVQQVIGLIGETLLWTSFDSDLAMLASSILRFIFFDATGLILLATAYSISRHPAARSS